MGESFVPGRGALYHIDPRSKIWALLLLVVWVFLPLGLAPLWVLVALLSLAMLCSVGFKHTVAVFLSISMVLFFMVLFMPLSERSGSPLVLLGGHVLVTREGLLQTLKLMGRLVAISLGCALLLATTRMGDIMLSLRSWRLPFSICLVLTLSFSTIPFVADTFREVQESHRLREADGQSPRHRLKDLIPTLTSVLVVSLRSIPFLAMTLEERGYGRKGKRSVYHDFSAWKHPLLSACGFTIAFVVSALFLSN